MRKFKTFKNSSTVTRIIATKTNRQPTAFELASFGDVVVGTVADIDRWSGPVVSLSGRYHRQLHPRLVSADEHYLFDEATHWMSVNWIDVHNPSYFDYQGRGVEVFRHILAFIERQTKPVLIACDQGLSRAPSVALVYLARTGKLTDRSYPAARDEFTHSFYPQYDPGDGIATFIDQHWTALLSKGDPHETDDQDAKEDAKE